MQTAFCSSGRGLAACFGLAMLLAAGTAQAGIVQFAQFTEVTSNQPLTFTNNGGTSGTLAYNPATQVNFNFTSSSGLSTINRVATLSLTGSPTSTPGFPLGGGGFLDQPLSSPLTMKLTEVGGPNPGANLLTLTFTGDIVGRGPTGSITGADISGQNVVFSSDFLTFAPPGSSYSLGLDTLSPGLSLGPGGFLNSFAANVSAQFSSSVTIVPTIVPEPASAAMFGIGLAAASARSLRRRGRLAPRAG